MNSLERLELTIRAAGRKILGAGPRIGRVAAVLVVLVGSLGAGFSCWEEEGDPPPPPPVPIAEVTSLPGVVAAHFVGVPDLPAATSIKQLVVARVEQIARGSLPDDVEFPLGLAATDSVRVIAGLKTNMLMKWFDPMGFDKTAKGTFFGANPDFLGFIPDDWGSFPADSAIWPSKGKMWRGWLFVNHEYISNNEPSAMAPPTGQALALAQHLKKLDVMSSDPMFPRWAVPDLDRFIVWHKKMLGGSWMRVMQDPSSGEWVVDRSVKNQRFDATSDTLFRMSGYQMSAVEQTDDGKTALPPNVVPGTAGNCSGNITPWGTIITAEENVQFYYGDFEACWDGTQKFVAGMGCDPGAHISPRREAARPRVLGFFPSGKNGRHAKDTLGWLTEIDPGQPAGEYDGKTTEGVGHKKLGAIGKARWENAAFALGPDWKPLEGKPLVIYAGDDRLGGRIWKFVSKGTWSASLTRAETRALLDEGSLHAAHFAGLDNAVGDKLLGGADPTESSPGMGRWVKVSLDSTDLAPNGPALGSPTKTVGEALADMTWNNMGGFANDNDVRAMLFTAAAKVGVMELNRPEDVEYSPKDPSGTPRIYVAFTNHAGTSARTQLDQDGVLRDPETHMMSSARSDKVGSIFVLQEMDSANPHASTAFAYFAVWRGAISSTDIYAAANPDNLVVDRDGDIWFGTDGNFMTQLNDPMPNAGRAHSDSYYFLNLNPTHKGTPVYGKAFRFMSVPSDAEATGPAFTPDMKTFFSSVQHPGENVASFWPPSQ
jgi:uncharacterized protein